MKFLSFSLVIFIVFEVFVLGVLAVPTASYAQVSPIEQRIAELQAKITLLQRELSGALKDLEGLLVEQQAEKARKAAEAEAAFKKQAEPATFCYKFKSPYLLLGLRDAQGEVVGNEVSRLQEILAKDSSLYPEGKVTGVFDIATKQAVGRFQAKYKLVGSTARGYGILGKQTMTFMNSLCGKEEGGQKSVSSPQVQEKQKSEAVSKKEELKEVKKEEKIPPQETGRITNLQDSSTEKNWVQVQYPNGGEEFFAGRSYTISWASSKAERVNIGVADEKGVAYVLARDVANEGKYLWIVPPYFASGDYKIRVAIPDVTNLAIDESDSAFKIRSKKIEVVAPSDEEIWFRGSTYKISWETTGIQSVKVEIVDQNGDARVLSQGVSTPSVFNWKVPLDWQLGQYTIRVTDVSSDAFSKPDRAESGFITVSRPPLPITIINPHDATNLVQVAKGQKNVEFLRFNILGDEDIVLKEFTLDDKQSGILDSLFENFTVYARGDLPVVLRVKDYDVRAGRRTFIIDSPWKISARNLPLSIRADIKPWDVSSRKEFTVSIDEVKGEGVTSQNPVQSQKSAQGTVIYNPKQ